ncbi:MAG: cytochrome c biogenesis protein ResB [Candidatus Eiseniibacteriota bacterium]
MQAIRSLVHWVLTIKFGVVLMLVLMGVMMFATQFEASYGTRAMKRYVYGSPLFDAGVFLFVVNIVVNTLRRRPFRWRHTGFLVVHAGVLTIVAGGLATRWFGIDGTMPIAEGSTSSKISLPDSDLVVTAAGHTIRHATDYDILPAEAEHDDLYDVPGTPYLMHVSRYYPSAAVADTLLNDAPELNPIVRVAVAGAAAPVSQWLVARDPARSTFLAGDVRVTFAESSGLPAVRGRWGEADGAVTKADPHGEASAGHLRLFWADGSSELLHVPQSLEGTLPTRRGGVSIEVVQVFRSFALTPEGHADAVDKPDNPAIRFRVNTSQGTEEHFSFTAFPEFRMEAPEGEERILSHAFWEPEHGGVLAAERLEVVLERRDDGSFATWTSWGDATDGAPLAVAETRGFGDQGVMLRVIEAADHGRLAGIVQKVSDEVIRPVVKVALVERDESRGLAVASMIDVLRGRPAVRPSAVEPAEAWVFHGESYQFQSPEGPIEVRYEGRSIPLDFGVHLTDFREETYPGVMLAASYESHVIVEPSDAERFDTRIYMNHPLVYAGYTFYQASFQRTQSGEEITVLSVARDPGMTVSFVGYCILVLGLVLIFFVKPYFKRLDDHLARSRAAAQGA